MLKVFPTIVAASCLLLLTFASVAQDLTIPQTEFSVSTEDSLSLEPGSQQKIGVWILRSKPFSGTTVRMTVSSTLPDGVLVNFQPRQGQFDYSEATISVNPATKPGIYPIIISGTIQYKTKGHVIKLTVLPPTISTKLR